MIIDFPSLTLYLVDYLWREQHAWIGMISYSKLGLGPLVTGLAETQPQLFEVLAKVDLLHLWTFGLWWVAVGIVMHVGFWVALLLSMVTFPCSHLFAVAADFFVTLVLWQRDGAGPDFAQCEEVERVRVAALLGGASEITYLNMSGREVQGYSVGRFR